MAIWAEAESWGKQHPVGLGIAIFVGGAILLYLFWPSSTAAPASTGQPSDAYYNAVASMAASGNQLQIANLQAQQDANATQAAVTVANNQVAGQVSVATINGQTATSVAQIQAVEDNYDTAQQAATQQLGSTLNAQVQTAAIAAQQNIAGINASAATTQAQIAANASIANTNTNAQVQEAGFAAQYAGLANTNLYNFAAGAYQTIGGTGIVMTPGGTFNITQNPVPSIQGLMNQGYTQAQANQIAATSTGIAALAG